MMTTDAHVSPLRLAPTSPASSQRAGGARSPEAHLAKRYVARLRVTDLIVVVIAMSVTVACRIYLIEGGSSRTTIVQEALLCAATAACWYAALAVSGSRDRRRLGAGTTEYKNVLSASVIVIAAFGIAGVVFDLHLRREFVLIGFPLGVLGLVLTRWRWRGWLGYQNQTRRYLSRALVVGAFDDVRYVMRQLATAGGATYNLVGAAVAEPGHDAVGEGGTQIPVIAGLDGAASAARTIDVDTVIVASQSHDNGEFVRALSWSLEGSGAELVLASPLVDVAGPRIRFSPVQGLPLIHVDIPQFDGGKHALKRAFDVVCSGIALVLLSPLLLVIAIAVKAGDGGPVLFRQERVGRDGSTFRMLKFRSMVANAEALLPQLRAQADDGNGVLFKLKNDPRVTPVGRVLRKYSLDEFPQLWNVLLGHMSLVGPRPALSSEVDGYDSPTQRRLYIKPGLTGMWQVSGRSDLSWEESIRLDLFYVENWSLAGDIVILWRTVRVLLHPSGAY